MRARTLSWLSVAIGLPAVHTPVLADSGDGYAGFSYSRIEYAAQNILSGVDIDDDEGGRRYFGGYWISDGFGVEGSWSSFKFKARNVTSDNSGFSADLDGNYRVLAVRGLGRIGSERVGLIGGVGLYHSKFDADAVVRAYWSGWTVDSKKTTDSGLSAIAGIEFNVDWNIGIRLDYEWFDSETGTDVSMASLGVVRLF
jgi:opacity protein-like surface antigen